MTKTVDLRLDATYLALREIGPWLRCLFDANGWGPDGIGPIELAIHELATNSVDHANPADGVLNLSAETNDDSLVVLLTDRGREFDESSVTAPDANQPQVRGYGLMIIEQVATSVSYSREDDTNCWTAQFPIPIQHPST